MHMNRMCEMNRDIYGCMNYVMLHGKSKFMSIVLNRTIVGARTCFDMFLHILYKNVGADY
jgi:hypothetical protein